MTRALVFLLFAGCSTQFSTADFREHDARADAKRAHLVASTGGAPGSGGSRGTGGRLRDAALDRDELDAYRPDGDAGRPDDAGSGGAATGGQTATGGLPGTGGRPPGSGGQTGGQPSTGGLPGTGGAPCKPKSCGDQGLACGAATDLCGTPLDCGPCLGSGSLQCVSGACVCVPSDCPFCAGTRCCKSLAACGCSLVPGAPCT
jgi:hypothetical protein